MRLLFDLMGAQTDGSRIRGIGRYTRELAAALAKVRDPRLDLRFALSGNFPGAESELRTLLSPLVAPDAITTYRTPVAPAYATPQDHPARRAGEAIVRRHVAGIAPNCLLASSLFEVAASDFSYPDLARQPAPLSAAILYDLIPLRMPKQYLSDPGYRRVYRKQTKALASADLLFAISECSRQDAVALLGCDAERIVNISGAADASFVPHARGPNEVADTLRRLGIRAPFILCGAGMDARKNAMAAVEAFLLLSPEDRRGTQFVLLAPLLDDQQAKLAALTRRYPVAPDAIRCIDRVSDDDLALLYAEAELFLFPSLYEGFGLPVLEAMQCGAAVIAGDNSSIREIADRADVRCDVSSAPAMALALAHGLRDANWRANVRAWGVVRAAQFSWTATALRLQDALLAKSTALLATRPRREPAACFALSETFESELAAALGAAPGGPTPAAVAPLALRSAPHLYDGSCRRLLIDASTIVGSDRRTGIQRVVRNVVRALYKADDLGDVVPVAVQLRDDRLHTCQGFVSDLLGCPQTVPDSSLTAKAGDCLLMLDNSWGAFDAFEPIFGDIRAAGGRVVTCVYDLIPELYPAASVDPVPAVYGRWLRAALVRSDGILTISEAVMHDLLRFLARTPVPVRENLGVGFFQCGSDIAEDARGSAGTVRTMLSGFLASGEPTFLLVGTVEPRKGQTVALDAFDRLWAAGVPARLLILGSRGWHIEALSEHIHAHPAYGTRLLWINNATDAELDGAYQRCAALLNPSYAEGFGLPLAEAARAGRPVICSDIPVFREVGRDGAIYHRVNDPEALAATIRGFLDGSIAGDPTRVLQTTWMEAAHRIVDVVMREGWSRVLNEKQRNGAEQTQFDTSNVRQ